MKRLALLFPLAMLVSVSAHAAVLVAFIELRRTDGTLIQLEPGGRFAHIALSFNGRWLHAHPQRGTEVVDDQGLAQVGRVAEIINVTDRPEPSEAVVQNIVGKPYDREYSWNDDRLYCSELVAKILGLKPEPMKFDSSLWAREFSKYRGQLGLSPDDIFRLLRQRNYPLLAARKVAAEEPGKKTDIRKKTTPRKKRERPENPKKGGMKPTAIGQ